jgi:serine/threonine protein kinase, bacterial
MGAVRFKVYDASYESSVAALRNVMGEQDFESAWAEGAPFTGLNYPAGVAVDTAGNVYVSDFNRRVLKLPARSNTQVELPLTGLSLGPDVAVDTAGNVYIADDIRVLKLPAGSNTQVELPFTGFNGAAAVAVDTAGDVYIADFQNKPGAQTTRGVEHPGRAAVQRPVRPLWGGGGPHRQQCLRRRRAQPTSAGAAGGRTLRSYCRSPAFHGPSWGWRWTPRATCTSPTAITTEC